MAIDVGTGDGRFVLGRARQQPDTFFIGIDPVAAAMADASRRAAAKPSRGGLENVVFVQASLEALPQTLHGAADRVTVNYPWGSLLRAVALPDAALLAKLAALAKPRAALDILINLQPLRDVALARKLGLDGAAIVHDHARLRGVYAGAGFLVRTIEDVTGAPVLATRWGSRLHHAGRPVVRVAARRSG